MHTVLLDLLATISPYDEREQADLTATRAWIRSGAELYRIAKPATPPQHLVVYCAVIDPKRQSILLVDHIKSGRWLPTGGHVEPNEHPATTAAREVVEELGLSVPLLWPNPLFLTISTTIGSTAGHTDVSLWYVLHGHRTAPLPSATAEFRGCCWFDYATVPFEQSDPHLRRFLDKLSAYGITNLLPL